MYTSLTIFLKLHKFPWIDIHCKNKIEDILEMTLQVNFFGQK